MCFEKLFSETVYKQYLHVLLGGGSSDYDEKSEVANALLTFSLIKNRLIR